MKNWLTFLVLAATLSLVVFNAQAQQVHNNPSGWCYQKFSNLQSWNPSFIRPLVDCFTEIDTTFNSYGFLPSVTLVFLTRMNGAYMPLVALMFLVVIALFGFKLMMGDVQRVKAEAITLGLKVAGILLFMGNAQNIYIETISVMQNLSESIANAATSLHSSGFCLNAINHTAQLPGNVPPTQWQNALWARWDCIFSYLFGFSTTLAESGVASFLLLMVFSMGTGIIVFFFFLYLIVALLCAAFRFVHIYLMAFLALSFMFCLGYLFVPLLIFRNTFEYFKKWLTLVFGYILTPVIMFGFMGMMLVALDVRSSPGQYSVWCVIGGPSKCGMNAGAGKDLFRNITLNVKASGATDPGSNPNLENSFKSIFSMALNGPQSKYTNPGNPAENSANSTLLAAGGSYKCSETFSGALGWICDRKNLLTSQSQTGSNYEATSHPTMADVGLEQAALNLKDLAQAAGSSCAKSSSPSPIAGGTNAPGDFSYYNNCPYVERILISVGVAALLVYIMIALLTYIPTLASNMTSDLMSQDIISAGGRVFKSNVLGEAETMKGLDIAKGAALNAAGQNSGRASAEMLNTDR